MVLNDFHCHFYTYDSGVVMDKIITWASSQNIITPDGQKEISVGMILNNIREKNLWESGVEFSMSRNRDNFTVIPFIGIHPWDSADADEQIINSLEEISGKTGAFIGEFGFDKLKGADKDKQLYIFRSCLEIALKSKKPFTIHCVRSWGLLTEELQKVKNRIKAPFIIHSYNGSAEIMKTITALGGYPSFALERYGAFSRKAEDSISKIDLKHLLLETDFTCYFKQQGSEDDDSDSENSANVKYSREDSYYGRKYIQRVLSAYNKAASVLKIDITELSGVIEENGKIFKAYAINRK
jgi:Tat protein secretion system quality control protein TatD with DNase activity